MTTTSPTRNLELSAPLQLVESFEQVAAERQCATSKIVVEAMQEWLKRNDQLNELRSELARLKDELRDQKDDLRDLKDDFRDLKDSIRERAPATKEN